MFPWAKHLVIHEIITCVRLHELGEKYWKPMMLARDEIASRGCHAIWFMEAESAIRGTSPSSPKEGKIMIGNRITQRQTWLLPRGSTVIGFFFSVMFLAGCGEFAIHDTDSLLLPGFRRSEVIGFLAGLGTTFAALPDLIAMLKRRSSEGMNPRMAAIMGTFQIVWVYYGLLILSRPVILWNAIAVGINALVVGAYFYLAQRKATM